MWDFQGVTTAATARQPVPVNTSSALLGTSMMQETTQRSNPAIPLDEELLLRRIRDLELLRMNHHLLLQQAALTSVNNIQSRLESLQSAESVLLDYIRLSSSQGSTNSLVASLAQMSSDPSVLSQALLSAATFQGLDSRGGNANSTRSNLQNVGNFPPFHGLQNVAALTSAASATNDSRNFLTLSRRLMEMNAGGLQGSTAIGGTSLMPSITRSRTPNMATAPTAAATKIAPCPPGKRPAQHLEDKSLLLRHRQGTETPSAASVLSSSADARLSTISGSIDASTGLVAGRGSIPLYVSCDDDELSSYQVLVRKQIEIFEAGKEMTER